MNMTIKLEDLTKQTLPTEAMEQALELLRPAYLATKAYKEAPEKNHIISCSPAFHALMLSQQTKGGAVMTRTELTWKAQKYFVSNRADIDDMSIQPSDVNNAIWNIMRAPVSKNNTLKDVPFCAKALWHGMKTLAIQGEAMRHAQLDWGSVPFEETDIGAITEKVNAREEFLENPLAQTAIKAITLARRAHDAECKAWATLSKDAKLARTYLYCDDTLTDEDGRTWGRVGQFSKDGEDTSYLACPSKMTAPSKDSLVKRNIACHALLWFLMD